MTLKSGQDVAKYFRLCRSSRPWKTSSTFRNTREIDIIWLMKRNAKRKIAYLLKKKGSAGKQHLLIFVQKTGSQHYLGKRTCTSRISAIINYFFFFKIGKKLDIEKYLSFVSANKLVYTHCVWSGFETCCHRSLGQEISKLNVYKLHRVIFFPTTLRMHFNSCASGLTENSDNWEKT